MVFIKVKVYYEPYSIFYINNITEYLKLLDLTGMQLTSRRHRFFMSFQESCELCMHVFNITCSFIRVIKYSIVIYLLKNILLLRLHCDCNLHFPICHGNNSSRLAHFQYKQHRVTISVQYHQKHPVLEQL